MDQSTTISVPAGTGYVHLLRVVIAGVAAGLDFRIDEIDDLRLAVDEAAAHLFAAGAAVSRITVRLTPNADGLDVLAWGDRLDGEWPGAADGRSMSWYVLTTLADDAEMERVDRHPAVHFSKRRAGREA
jgi:anti-sigma regulatory factor (Ser/Thr protein kinase)